jgi:O-methyltransferase
MSTTAQKSVGISPSVASAYARALYLDLLTKILVNSIYEDPPVDPWNDKTYHEEIRAVGKDWPRSAHTMVGLARLTNLRELVQRTLDEGIPGDYVETGVWRGGCCIMIKGVLAANCDKDRKVFAADSFAGLPLPRPDEFVADAGDDHHTFPELSVPIEEVKNNFAKYGLLDERTIFVEGYFDKTLPTLRKQTFALIRLDGDMYSSTITALENLYDRVSPGGYIIIDDYGAVAGCRKAVDDYRERNKIKAPLSMIDWTGVWWRRD